MVYSTGCVAEDSWRRGGWCALVGKIHHLLHLVGYLFTFMIQDARSHEIKIIILELQSPHRKCEHEKFYNLTFYSLAFRLQNGLLYNLPEKPILLSCGYALVNCTVL
jgi:hypothetical protein